MPNISSFIVNEAHKIHKFHSKRAHWRSRQRDLFGMDALYTLILDRYYEVITVEDFVPKYVVTLFTPEG